MVINSSGVGMESISSRSKTYTETMSMEIKSLGVVTGSNLFFSTPKLQVNADGTIGKKDIIDGGKSQNFLKSLNYALGKNGEVSTADDKINSEQQLADSKVRMGTISYLLRLVLDRLYGNNSLLSEMPGKNGRGVHL